MTQAYLKYDPITGRITNVTWSQLSGNSITISSTLAENFILGVEKLLDWQVNLALSPPEATKKIESIAARTAPSLIDLTSDSESICTFEKDTAVFETSRLITDTTILYITLKNNPSWLVLTTTINPIDLFGKKKFIVTIQSATAYSYYIG